MTVHLLERISTRLVGEGVKALRLQFITACGETIQPGIGLGAEPNEFVMPGGPWPLGLVDHCPRCEKLHQVWR